MCAAHLPCRIVKVVRAMIKKPSLTAMFWWGRAGRFSFHFFSIKSDILREIIKKYSSTQERKGLDLGYLSLKP